MERGDLENETRSIVRECLAAAGAAVAAASIQTCSHVADWVGPRAARLGLTQYTSGAKVALELMAPGFPLVAELSGGFAGVAEVGAGCGALGLALAVLCPTVEAHSLTVAVAPPGSSSWSFAASP